MSPLNSLLDYVVNYPIEHEPGTFFVYSNVGPYLLSAIIQEELGVNLADWVSHLLFRRIGINQYSWKNYGKYCAACTGLEIDHRDLHKIGKLFVTGGVLDEQIRVPADWLEAMTRQQVLTPSMYDESRVFPKFSYGFYLWVCKDGTFYCDGTDGQYLIVLPKKRMVITTYGHQSDMKPITECLRPLLS